MISVDFLNLKLNSKTLEDVTDDAVLTLENVRGTTGKVTDSFSSAGKSPQDKKYSPQVGVERAGLFLVFEKGCCNSLLARATTSSYGTKMREVTNFLQSGNRAERLQVSSWRRPDPCTCQRR